MGYGTFVMSSYGNRDEKVSAIKKIWHTFGRGGFISSQLRTILTKEELSVVNMNRFKHRNLVEHDGWEKIKGKPYRKWKLTSHIIDQCARSGDDKQNDS
jgi:hypothetical protein